MINRTTFFSNLPIFKTITHKQMQGMNAILDEWEAQGLYDARHLAYMMATCYWETARTMQPIEEYGKGKGRPYGTNTKHSGVKYEGSNLYYGRGFVQLTWYENYELMGRLLGIDLLNKPELALDMTISVKILFEGMMKGSSSFGDFTGKCLEMYFNDTKSDAIGARKIINGQDRAQQIADYYMVFLLALQKSI